MMREPLPGGTSVPDAAATNTPVDGADRRIVVRRLARNGEARQELVRQDAGIGAAPRRHMDRADGDGVGRPGAADRSITACRSSAAAKNPSVPCAARASATGYPSSGEVGMAGEEGGHLSLVLLGEQGTGSVDQTPAGANQ